MLSEDKIVPYHATDLTGRRVLVLAPHPDDETLGCGGSLVLHVRAGDPVKVVFLTDGAKGDFSGRDDPGEYAQLRRKEAEAACAALGIADREFWPFEDRKLAESRAAVDRLIDLLESFRPELVYAPSPFEFHPDHRAAAFFLFDAVTVCGLDFDIALYEVNQPLKVNCLVDITDVAEEKYTTFSVYATQMRERDFTDLSRGLDRFRSLTLPDPAMYAEAFYLVNSSEIRRNGFELLYQQDVNRLFPEADETGSLRRFAADRPVFSVIIPTRNRRETLAEAVKSVMAQTFRHFEIIVVNDGGEDVSELLDALNKDGRIRYLAHEERRDVAAARNTGLRAAKGFYIAYLDDDDIYYPDHLSTLVHVLEHADCRVAYTDSYQVVMNWITDRFVPTEKRVRYSHDFDREKLLVSNYIPTLNIAHRRDLLEEIGYFDESLDIHEDWDMWIRASVNHDFRHVRKTTAEYRVWIGRRDSKSEQKIRFLDTIRHIHQRYAHLVKSPAIFEAQKRAQNALALDLKDSERYVIFRDYRRRHFYRFAGGFATDRNVLDINCADGEGSRLLAASARSVVATGHDRFELERAGAKHVRENLRFVRDFFEKANAEGENAFDLVVCDDVLDFIRTDAAAFLGKVKSLLSREGVFIFTVPRSRQAAGGAGGPGQTGFNTFRDMLEKHFPNVRLWEQRVYPVSSLTADSGRGDETAQYMTVRGTTAAPQSAPGHGEPGALVAMASAAPLPAAPKDSLLVDTGASLFSFWETYADRLESAKNEKEAHVAELEAELKDREKHLTNLESELSDQRRHAANLEEELADLRIHAANLDHEFSDLRRHAANLEKELEARDAHVGSLEADRATRQEIVKSLEERIRELEEALAGRQSEIERLSMIAEERSRRISALESAVAEKNIAVGSLEAELSVIRHSLGWRVVEGLRRRVNRFFPEPSRRRKLYLKCVSGAKIYLDRGFFGLLKAAARKLFRRQDPPAAGSAPEAPPEDGPAGQMPGKNDETAEFRPVRCEPIDDEQGWANESDRRAIGEKIHFIKQELLDEVRRGS